MFLIGFGIAFGTSYWGSIGSEPITGRLDILRPGQADLSLESLETALVQLHSERLLLSDGLADLAILVESFPRAGDGAAEGPEDSYMEELEIAETLLKARIDRFAEFGIAPEHAQFIIQREAEIEMQALEGRYLASQSGEAPEVVSAITPLSLLRDELGDAVFAQYLEARGRSNSIMIGEILRGSQAEIVGLRSRDEVIAYDGRRVFDIGELTSLTLAEPPETLVPLTVIREGQTLYFLVESGPLGITSGTSSSHGS